MTVCNSRYNLFWFRRDLRLWDNHGLAKAISAGVPLLPIFIFDSNILKGLDRRDRRVEFIHQTICQLDKRLASYGSGIRVFVGQPAEVFARLLEDDLAGDVYCNEDYEPFAIERDKAVESLLLAKGKRLLRFKDQVLFAKDDIVKNDGTPFRVFTAYMRRWLERLEVEMPKIFPVELSSKLLVQFNGMIPTLEQIGFLPVGGEYPEAKIYPGVLRRYEFDRDQLALEGTSHLGIHLRFGTLAIRRAVEIAQKYSHAWLKELIWREFFMQFIYFHPSTVTEPFDEKFSRFPWRTSEEDFAKWTLGQTGYPVVDAGMRELNATGFMHNRARMICASFLTKHLLIDWRLGERYFARHLLDFDLSANVGNWQWVAGSGVDAAPYFRIFNPTVQQSKYDSSGAYVARWVPEILHGSYCEPIVDHEAARRRALLAYQSVRSIPRTHHS